MAPCTSSSLPPNTANEPRQATRRMTINMSFSLGSDDAVEDELEDLLSQLYGAAAETEDIDEDEREVITSVDYLLGIKDSLTLVKCSPVGTTLSVNYDVESDEAGGHGAATSNNTTFYEEILVETKTEPDASENCHRATRRMSINMATKRVSISMTHHSAEGLDSELQGILQQLYEAPDGQGEGQATDSTNETSTEATGYDVGEFGIRRDSLSLVKCRPYRRLSVAPQFADVPEEEDSAGNVMDDVVETKE
ncbi:hypothetical protein HJC23_013820 [Cyclotella cryptica]|uniref:Uncharacterized protein n=1 Tax=Cyclotella cryptica TaxID=29204 RepID=A0ABD3P1R1_9STRA|eukprot:CCRYP_018170-RA/>CCRYP_018170-RA protein AED:0.32 eAED:0.32 QI:0/-1/0/1/-1/1/1/0/250